MKMFENVHVMTDEPTKVVNRLGGTVRKTQILSASACVQTAHHGTRYPGTMITMEEVVKEKRNKI